ncbi:uncharacterized protein ColSpa_04485 [Colletotrichum spaethianum]|uniref:Uncharacterized protein n=1 Tax=Colletotrichum spaethianum TaxID=700344 RepID=A0AA37LBJ7_9PEZI|nr:uncharacterized protein ColSpa_04485 [Colletotrichum spaethianum]GKT44304.1 hypothetical protein ColSpa_04485 [Colletotrichum spaethianum]
MLQSQGSTDARSIIFCIAMSDLYVLPNTWYRVTYLLLNGTSGRSAYPFKSPPTGAAMLLAAATITFIIFVVP